MDSEARKQVVDALVEFYMSFVSEDPQVGRENYRDVLLEGWKGYENMTDEELQFELDSEIQNLLKDGEDLVEDTPLQAVRHLAKVARA